MNFRFSRLFLLVAVLVLSCAELQSQAYPTSTADTDSTASQSTAGPCSDLSDPNTEWSADCLQDQRMIQGQVSQQSNELQRDFSLYPSSRSSRVRSITDSNISNQRQDYKIEQEELLRLPPEPPTEFQRFVAATTGQVLPIYGASLFKRVPSTFSPNDTAPATADYVVGPDDELRVRIWGQVTYSANLRVDRSGNIYIEGVGSIPVAGLRFSSLDQHLRAAVSRVYRNFDLSVDMGKIRSIQVYLTGQARRTGAYTISSLSSLVDALFTCGGPSGQGSLRHIELHRDGKLVTDFDLYALLIHGDKSKDVRLQPEDVIFISPVGRQVAITGSVHNPSIYEMREGESIADLIDLAGKTTTVASNARISIDRIIDQRRQAMEISFDDKGKLTELADGDIVQIFSIIPAYRNTITLRGNVSNPGRFGWHSGMHISDLIPDRESLVSRDYWWKRSHLGLPGPEFEPIISALGRNPSDPQSTRQGYTTSVTQETLRNALAPQQDSRSTRKDQNNHDSNFQTGQTNQIREQYPDVSGSLGPRANGADINAPNISDLSNARPNPNLISTPAPTNDVRLSSADIDWSYAVVERLNPDTLKTSLLPFDLGKLVLQHDTTQDFLLEAGDSITIFSQADIRVPLEQQTKYVRLDGEFAHSGVYSVMPGETLRDLVQRAGGLTKGAYLYGSEFDRESTRILQQQRIDEYVSRVDLEAQRGTLAITASASSSAGSLASTAGARTAEQDLITRLKQIRATGRIVLNIGPKNTGLDDLPALGLENGDRFIVPPLPATINIVGAVNNQNSFEFQAHETTGQYLLMAGGQDRDADRSHSFIIRANGSVLGRTGTKGLWGNRFNDVQLFPGDTIVVPDRTLRPTALRGLLDWTQIFSQLAIGAAAVNVLR